MLEIKEANREYVKYTPIAYVFFVAVYILFFSAGYYIKQHFFRSTEVKVLDVVTSEKKKTAPVDDLPTAEQLNYLLSRNKEKTLAVVETRPIKTNTIPVEILNLLVQVQFSDSKSVEFEGGKIGYEAVFYLGDKVEVDFLGFIKTIDKKLWNVVSASYAENAGILKIENIKYQISFEFTQKADLQTKVKMTAIVK